MASSGGALAHFQPMEPKVMVRRRAERLVTREVSLDEAMDRYAQGDAGAFAVIYAGLEQKLRSFLMRLAGAAPIADDLLQETFMRIHRARGSFEPGARVVPWAYAIARNAWLDHARSAHARSLRERDANAGDDPPSAWEPATGPEADSEQTAIAREMAAVVQRVLAGLPPAQREAFVLLRYEGMSVQEAAEVLGSTPTAVKLRAFRAYEALRAALSQTKNDRGGDDGR
jgi:RNA polymerase sigma-70 factor (ECF subfamily)